MSNSASLVGAIMQKVTGQQNSEQMIDIVDAVAQHRKELYGDRKGVPSGMTAEEFYNHLIHRGALQERDDGTVICPIPSFRRFLVEELLQYEQQEQYRHDRDVLRHRVLPDEILSGDLPDERSPYLH